MNVTGGARAFARLNPHSAELERSLQRMDPAPELKGRERPTRENLPQAQIHRQQIDRKLVDDGQHALSQHDFQAFSVPDSWLLCPSPIVGFPRTRAPRLSEW